MPDNIENIMCNQCRQSKAFCRCAKKTSTSTNPKSTEQAQPSEKIKLKWKNMDRQQKLQRALTIIGYVLAGIIAVGSGVSTAAAFISLNIVSAGAASFILPGLIFLAGTLMNWYINKNAVPAVLVDMFGRGGFFKGFLIDAEGKPLPKGKKIAMGLGFFFALSVGITNAMLTYSGTFHLPLAFGFLASISPALPAIAAVLAAVTLVCLTALMFKTIADFIKKDGIFKSMKQSLTDLFSPNPDLPQNKGKTRGRIWAEKITAGVLMAVLLPISALGLFMTMNAGANGTKAFLLKYIPHISVVLVNVISKTISLGFALIGRIPFTVRNIYNMVAAFFKPRNKPAKGAAAEQAKPSAAAQAGYVASAATLYSLAAANGASNGLISIEGAGGLDNPLGVAAGVGGAIISLAAGLSNINLKKPQARVSQEAQAESKKGETLSKEQQPDAKPTIETRKISVGSHRESIFSRDKPAVPAPAKPLPPKRVWGLPHQTSKVAQGVDPLLAMEKRRMIMSERSRYRAGV